MDENIYMENFIYKMMNESFSDIIAAVQKILFASLEQRLVGFLLDEAARCHSDQILMTQEQIARAIGSAREAVSRTLKELVKEGSVELFRGGVKIMDRKSCIRKSDTARCFSILFYHVFQCFFWLYAYAGSSYFSIFKNQYGRDTHNIVFFCKFRFLIYIYFSYFITLCLLPVRQ